MYGFSLNDFLGKIIVFGCSQSELTHCIQIIKGKLVVILHSGSHTVYTRPQLDCLTLKSKT